MQVACESVKYSKIFARKHFTLQTYTYLLILNRKNSNQIFVVPIFSCTKYIINVSCTHYVVEHCVLKVLKQNIYLDLVISNSK